MKRKRNLYHRRPERDVDAMLLAVSGMMQKLVENIQILRAMRQLKGENHDGKRRKSCDRT